MLCRRTGTPLTKTHARLARCSELVAAVWVSDSFVTSCIRFRGVELSSWRVDDLPDFVGPAGYYYQKLPGPHGYYIRLFEDDENGYTRCDCNTVTYR